MTCYFRHRKQLFTKAGITLTPENKRDLDEILHSFVNVKYKNCAATWKLIKEQIAADEAGFISKLQDLWKK